MMNCQAIKFSTVSGWSFFNPFSNLSTPKKLNEENLKTLTENGAAREIKLAKQNPGQWIYGTEKL
jgi:hypothetical protein